MEYCLLGLMDLTKVKNIRLELLQKEPTSFGSSYEEESVFENYIWVNRLTKPNIKTVGAFDGEELIGIVLGVQNPRKKMNHIMEINSMYVKEEYRGKGIGKALIDRLLSEIDTNEVEMIRLSVVSTNQQAIALYKKIGFVEYAVDPKVIKYQGTYYDLIQMNLNTKRGKE